MRFNKFILLFLWFFGCEISDPYRWESGISFQDLRNNSNGKIVLLDFETEWCGWCKKMDKNTFNDKSVISYANNQFVSMKVDAEKGEGIELAKKYNVSGYPTIVFTNADGIEIDRIVGYKEPLSYLSELKRIRSGKNTLPTLLTEFQTNPKKFGTLFKLAKKYESMGDAQSAKKMIDAIIVANIDSAGTGEFFEILYNSRETQDPSRLIDYIQRKNKGGYLAAGIQEAMNLIRKKGDNPTLEADLFLKLINMSESVSPSMLNSFSWRMSELEMNLDLAIDKINIAIENVNDNEQKYMFIDTKAEILWKLKKIEEAIIEIEKCISAFPKNEYYKEQLEKFQNSIIT